ncbi:MAG: DUF222 domain-containing protein [Gordonia sp. (in: high G+C Gram-positive bacteria)]|uniref:HNH endonuclease signature motif containing protein n=1 Tax=Gordonia sp. (in: high G+C Gram-positive bacteria) TaxID=84139 RepID=UPI0039E650B7
MGSDIDPVALLEGLDIATLLAVQDAAERRLADAVLSPMSEDDLLDALEHREQTRRRGDVFDAALYVEISDRQVFRKAGAPTIHHLYAHGLRLGGGEARRRKVAASGLGRFTTMTGERRDPVLPETASAVAEGDIGREHVIAISTIMDRIPSAVAHDDRESAEAMLAAAARSLAPDGVMKAGAHILAHLDPDGTLADDKDRERRRGLQLGPQDRQLMRSITGSLTPVAAAAFEITLLHWAARGMNNPDDPDSPRGADDAPGIDTAALAAAAERDTRTVPQRQHDALLALLAFEREASGHGAGTSGAIGSQIVVTVTDEDLAGGAGVAWTATGTLLPIADLVKLATDAIPYLAVFSKSKGQPLWLGRSSRFANHAQRLALFARDRGCTAPGCGRPFVHTQAHHLLDWADGGSTDIDDLGAACGTHNRSVGTNPGQWETAIQATGTHAGRVGWRPAGRDGPWHTNPIHHPDRLEPQQLAPPATGPPAAA